MAQVPQGISHQAVIRDANNALVTESPIGIQVSILQGAPAGVVVYSETHTPQSNANGLITFIIGQGLTINGVFAEIDWAETPYFIKIEADPQGGSNYTIEGVSQILSVPYALHSSALTLTSANGFQYNLSIDDYGNFSSQLIPGQPCPGLPTVSDIDGNVYNTVMIGNQCWMRENLKTTKYSDGTPIEYPGNDNEAWAVNTNGAYSWYDNDLAYKNDYGALYNWHAVGNSKGLCPSGWKVPSHEEFSILEGTVDSQYGVGDPIWDIVDWRGYDVGKILKSTTLWLEEGKGTDDFGASIVPASRRVFNGNYGTLGDYAFIWLEESFNDDFAWSRYLSADSDNTRYGYYLKEDGRTVRCLQGEALLTPRVSTSPVTNISLNNATSGGNVTNEGGSPVLSRGVVWSASPNPTLEDNFTEDGTGTGSFISEITGLTHATDYYVRAYATNDFGIAYGNEVNFTTQSGEISLSTNPVTDIMAFSATSGGDITSDGGSAVSARGVVWSINPNPTLADNFTEDGAGTGSYISEITGLIQDTEYYVRAYATNALGTQYGNEFNFSTQNGEISLTTNTVTNIMALSATSGGDITSDGGAPVSARGIVWSTNPNPTLADNFTEDGTGTGSYNSEITGLIQATEYYVRAYATNAIGSEYGNEFNFTTQDGVIVLTTNEVTDITNIAASSGGNIASDGGAYVISRGVVWSTSENPTINDNDGISSDGTGIGEYISNLTGLNVSTVYYARAYANNAVDTYYGSNQTFRTYHDMLTDFDGNTYGTVLIGTQEWMAENLKTTHYRNGTAIENPTGNSDWIANTSGAYAWYDNDISWKDSYGALYNWFAVTNANALCPLGWQVPTGADFTILTNLFGGIYNGGGHLKSTRTDPDPHPRWESPNVGATNESNWSGLPGGRRHTDGQFMLIGYYGTGWTSNEHSESTAWTHYLYNSGNYSVIDYYPKVNGFSVRCIKSETTSSVVPSVTTSPIIEITSNSATSGGNVYNDGGAEVTARGIVWSSTANPTIETNEGITLNESGIGVFMSTLTSLTPETIYYVRAYATNSVGTAYGDELSFTTDAPPFVCGTSTITDIDNNIYNTVLIGNQCWMKENLKTTKYRNDNPIEYPGSDNNAWTTNTSGAYTWYDNNIGWKESYGALYNWNAVNNANGLCPSGWHVPTDAEYTAMTDYLGGTSVAGGKMKSTLTAPDPHPRWESPNTGATNESNWSGLPGGFRYDSGSFIHLGLYGIVWSSTEVHSTGAWLLQLSYQEVSVLGYGYGKAYGFSVRCLKD